MIYALSICYRTKMLLLIVLLASPSYARAAPRITGVSGTSAHFITGTGFGIKSTPAPYRFDRFEDGAIGDRVHGRWYSEDTSGSPTYTTDEVRYSGGTSVVQRYGADYRGAVIGLRRSSAPSTKELYVSGWFWMETMGAASRNVKIMNFFCGDYGSGGWQSRIDVYPVNGSGHMYSNLSSTCLQSGNNSQDWGANPSNTMLPDKNWHRIESYLRIGTDGFRDLWVDGVKIAENSGSFTADSCTIDTLFIGHYFATDVGDPVPSANRYWDELYVDTTQARVEIGNASTWEACTHREIQPITVWNDTNIQVTPNYGTFNTGDQAFLYVVDRDGNVSNLEAGFPITIGTSATCETDASLCDNPDDCIDHWSYHFCPGETPACRPACAAHQVDAAGFSDAGSIDILYDVIATRDATPPALDVTPAADTATPAADAAPAPDAATPAADAAPAPDTATPAADAAPAPDAATPAADAATPAADAATPAADATVGIDTRDAGDASSAEVVGTGCGCAAQSSPKFALILGVIVLLGYRSRRRWLR